MAPFIEKFKYNKLQKFGLFEFVVLIFILAALYWISTSRPFYPPAQKLDRREVPVGDFPETDKETSTEPNKEKL